MFICPSIAFFVCVVKRLVIILCCKSQNEAFSFTIEWKYFGKTRTIICHFIYLYVKFILGKSSSFHHFLLNKLIIYWTVTIIFYFMNIIWLEVIVFRNTEKMAESYKFGKYATIFLFIKINTWKLKCVFSNVCPFTWCVVCVSKYFFSIPYFVSNWKIRKKFFRKNKFILFLKIVNNA